MVYAPNCFDDWPLVKLQWGPVFLFLVGVKTGNSTILVLLLTITSFLCFCEQKFLFLVVTVFVIVDFVPGNPGKSVSIYVFCFPESVLIIGKMSSDLSKSFSASGVYTH